MLYNIIYSLTMETLLIISINLIYSNRYGKHACNSYPIDNAGRDAGDFWLIMDKMAGKWVKRPLLPCLGFNSSYTDLG